MSVSISISPLLATKEEEDDDDQILILCLKKLLISLTVYKFYNKVCILEMFYNLSKHFILVSKKKVNTLYVRLLALKKY